MNDCAQPCKCTACWWHIGFTNVVSPFGPDRFCVTRVVVLYFRRRTFTMSFYTAFVQVVTRRNQHTTCVWHTGFHKCHIVQRIYYILEITMWFHCVRMTWRNYKYIFPNFVWHTGLHKWHCMTRLIYIYIYIYIYLFALFIYCFMCVRS